MSGISESDLVFQRQILAWRYGSSVRPDGVIGRWSHWYNRHDRIILATWHTRCFIYPPEEPLDTI